jgi:hypothetical protein
MSSKHASLKASSITCVVRGEDKAKALANIGVNTLLFNGLDESDVLAEAASEHDGKLIIPCSLWLETH